MFLGSLLCLYALYILSPYGPAFTGDELPKHRLNMALLLAGVGIVLILRARKRARDAPKPSEDEAEASTPASTPYVPAAIPTSADSWHELLRGCIAMAICIGTWMLPFLVQAANGRDNSDQALGRVFVALIICGVLGPVLAWWFLRGTRRTR